MESGHVALAITGMTCGHCVAAVKKALAAVPGVEAVEVTLSPPARWFLATLEDNRGDACEGDAEEGYPPPRRPDNRRESCSSGRTDGRWESTPSTHKHRNCSPRSTRCCGRRGCPARGIWRRFSTISRVRQQPFRLEELYMRRLSYPGFPSHKGEHVAFINDFYDCGTSTTPTAQPRAGRQDGPLHG